MIRARPLDVKGLVNETYELLRGGDWDGLDRKGLSSPGGLHGITWLRPSGWR